jgi:hypothetical protein
MADIQKPVSNKVNPLASFMRQPKIYISLPSKGLYWPEGSLTIPENGQLAVYSMTAKDELTFKTPDALLNGQAVIDVIQSCIPDIKDAWKTPNIDLDTILIAIRLATYGEKMDLTHTVPNTTEEVTYQIDLRMLLDQVSNETHWDEAVVINDNLTCFVRPLTYKHITLTNMKTFETQRLMQAVNDDAISDEKKIEIFNQSFGIMTDITIELVADSISAIKTPDVVVEDTDFIKDFLQKADKEVYQKVQTHISNLKETNGIRPLKITSTPEQIELGAPETYELPITIDNSDFFGRGS